MTYNPNPQDQGWVTCRDRLLDTIAKWQKTWKARDVTISCPAAPRYTSKFREPADRAVSVTFSAGKHVDRTVTIDRFERPRRQPLGARYRARRSTTLSIRVKGAKFFLPRARVHSKSEKSSRD